MHKESHSYENICSLTVFDHSMRYAVVKNDYIVKNDNMGDAIVKDDNMRDAIVKDMMRSDASLLLKKGY